MSEMIWRLCRIALWAAASFALVMAVLPHPLQISPSDKAQHMLAFATLTLFASLGYPRAFPTRIAVALGVFGALIEVVQAIPALHRDADIRDWLADMLAVGVVLAIVAIGRRVRRNA